MILPFLSFPFLAQEEWRRTQEAGHYLLSLWLLTGSTRPALPCPARPPACWRWHWRRLLAGGRTNGRTDSRRPRFSPHRRRSVRLGSFDFIKMHRRTITQQRRRRGGAVTTLPTIDVSITSRGEHSTEEKWRTQIVYFLLLFNPKLGWNKPPVLSQSVAANCFFFF